MLVTIEKDINDIKEDIETALSLGEDTVKIIIELDTDEVYNELSFSERYEMVSLLDDDEYIDHDDDSECECEETSYLTIEDKMFMMDKEECEYLTKLIEKYENFG